MNRKLNLKTNPVAGLITFGTALCLLSVNALGQDDPDLYAYDGFDYPFETSIEQQDSGTGWDGAWGFRRQFDGKGGNVSDSAFVEEGEENKSLTYQDLTTSGRHVHLYGDFGSIELGRALENDIPGEDGTSTYISFIGQRVGPEANPEDEIYEGDYPYGDNLYPRGAAVRFFNSDNGEILQIGNFSNQDANEWGVFYGEGTPHAGVPFTELAFVVVRIDHQGDETVADSIYMWVNPDLEAGEDTSTAQVAQEDILEDDDPEKPIDFSNISWVSPWAGNGDDFRPHAEMLLDELRIGKTWDSVTPQGGTVDPGPEMWGPFEPDEEGIVNTGDKFLQWVNVRSKPWIWSYTLETYIYMPGDYIDEGRGSWGYVANSGSESRDTSQDSHWGGFSKDANNDVKTGVFLGWINVRAAPWVYSYSMELFILAREQYVSDVGTWVYFRDTNPAE